MCFEKAHDAKNGTIARGKIEEEEGRRCEARGEHQDSQLHFQAAIDCFLTVDLVREAVNLYARLGRFHQAAGWSLLLPAQLLC